MEEDLEHAMKFSDRLDAHFGARSRAACVKIEEADGGCFLPLHTTQKLNIKR